MNFKLFYLHWDGKNARRNIDIVAIVQLITVMTSYDCSNINRFKIKPQIGTKNWKSHIHICSNVLCESLSDYIIFWFDYSIFFTSLIET